MGGGDLAALLVCGAGKQGGGTRRDTQAFEEGPLEYRSMDNGATFDCGPAEGGKIDVGRNVGRPRFVQRVVKAMASERLKGVSGGALDMSVIDDQRSTTALRQALAKGTPWSPELTESLMPRMPPARQD